MIFNDINTDDNYNDINTIFVELTTFNDTLQRNQLTHLPREAFGVLPVVFQLNLQNNLISNVRLVVNYIIQLKTYSGGAKVLCRRCAMAKMSFPGYGQKTQANSN